MDFHHFGTVDDPRAQILAQQVGTSGFDADLTFKTEPGDRSIVRLAERVSITSTGNVGIGTASPEGTLHIVDQGATGPNLFLENATITEGDIAVNEGEALNFGHWNKTTDTFTSRLEIDSNGRVGIGTTSPDQKLSVNGNASKVGGGSWATFSDRRLKTVHGPFVRGLKELLQLKPISYNYNDDNPLDLPNEKDHIGFVAQEVEAVIPEAITYNKKGFLMVDNDPIIWTMLNAVKEVHGLCEMSQEQQKSIESRVDSNEREIASLKAENAALKARLESETKSLKERLEVLERLLRE